MRVLMTSFAQEAHFNGMVPLAWALRTAGHEVRVAGHPALTDSITKSGLTAVPVGPNHMMDEVMRSMGGRILGMHQVADFLENRPERLSLDFLKGHDSVMTSTFYSQVNGEAMVDDLVEFGLSWKPDLVLWEPFTFAGAVAARACGSAHARVLSFPDLFLSTRRTLTDKLASGPEERHDDVLAEWLSWTALRHGEEFGDDLVEGQWSIDQTPGSVRLESAQTILPMRYIPHNGSLPAVIPPWLRQRPERPRVAVTLGMTVRNSEFPNAVDVADLFDAVADLDIEVVATLTAPDLERVSEVPGNVRLVEHVPLHALLTTCSAIVHHGGAGTWSTAAAQGVPQVALGWMWDAIYRAQSLERLGAGLYLHSHELTATLLRDRILRVLQEPSFPRAADRLAQEITAMPNPNDVVPELERLTNKFRRRP